MTRSERAYKKLFTTEQAERYDYETETYQQYILPEGAAVFAELGQEVSCAGCGEKLLYDDSYTSMSITNGFGFGFMICEKCLQQELKARRLKKGGKIWGESQTGHRKK